MSPKREKVHAFGSEVEQLRLFDKKTKAASLSHYTSFVFSGSNQARKGRLVDA